MQRKTVHAAERIEPFQTSIRPGFASLIARVGYVTAVGGSTTE